MNKNPDCFWQDILKLPPLPRGFHLIQSDIERTLQKMPPFKIGLVNLFLQHTSASLCITERCDIDVCHDLEQWFNQQIPDNRHQYTHTIEGEDDMPAHIKNSLLGASLTLPIRDQKIALGTWQGIVLGEHRNQAGSRTIIITAHGHLG
ncbi:MAG: YjbQ family protein [Legionellaceae bacterium]|nr:YjbQ family protein [Legionellaceae bacterium]